MIMDKNQEEVEAVEEVMDAEAEVEKHDSEEEKDTTDWKMKHDELAARLKRAETKLEKKKVEEKVEKVLEKKEGELDENALAFLDVKGISDDDEIEIVHNVMKRTGQSVREALKDDYVLTKLAELRQENAVKDAIPGSTRRSQGGAVDTVSYWKSRAEQKGDLPKDPELKRKVLQALDGKHDESVPPWKRR